MTAAPKPLRVLHVLGSMNRGGVEAWLVNVFRQGLAGVSFDVMVHEVAAGAFDATLQDLGVALHRNPYLRNPLAYWKRLSSILRDAGPFDVVHSHVHHYSGVVLAAAAWNGVPTRVAHSHSDTSAAQAEAPWKRRAYFRLMEAAIDRYATQGFACSDLAARSLLGEAWQDDLRWRRLYCGIDAASYDVESATDAVRAEFGLNPESRLLIHVGRFDAPKNHQFLLEVFAALCHRRDDLVLLLVGCGPLQRCIRQRAAGLGIAQRVVFCGARDDVPRLLTASNVFLFPSLYEGLPLACLEAQAAGIQVVVSDQVTPEVLLDRRLSTPLPLAVDRWAAEVEVRSVVPRQRELGLSIVRASQFEIGQSARALVDAYRHRKPGAVAEAASSAVPSEVPPQRASGWR